MLLIVSIMSTIAFSWVSVIKSILVLKVPKVLFIISSVMKLSISFTDFKLPPVTFRMALLYFSLADTIIKKVSLAIAWMSQVSSKGDWEKHNLQWCSLIVYGGWSSLSWIKRLINGKLYKLFGVYLYLIFEMSIWKFITNSKKNWFLWATQAVKIKFEIEKKSSLICNRFFLEFVIDFQIDISKIKYR